MHLSYIWPRLTVLTGVVSLSTMGCVENESSLFVRGVLSLEDDTCTASPDPGGTMLARGVMDRTLTDRYMAALLVGNQMVGRGSAGQIRTESNRVSLQGAEVRVTDTGGNKLAEFSVEGTGFVDPASGSDPGYGVLFATLLYSPEGLDRNVVAWVRVFGRTLGGREMESGELAFPITICDACLIDYPTEADDPEQQGYQCVRPSDGELEVPCFFGQDEAVDCRLCSASYSECVTPF